MKSKPILWLLLLLIFSNITFSQSPNNADEKKVDYLERIYFSGEPKDGLNTKILITLQELEGKTPTTALAKQVTFLIEIKEKASAAENACDILDLLAVGIYNIDAAEAVQQGVRMPSEKAKAKSVDALASLGKLNGTANNLSGSASNLAWSSYLLGGGKYSGFTSGASKVAGTAAQVGNIAGAVGQAAQTGKQLVDVGKSLGVDKLFKKKDKPCNDVEKKDIVIGEHGQQIQFGSSPVNNTSNDNSPKMTTVISIAGISSIDLRVLTDSIKLKISTVSTEKSFNESFSTITVVHSGSTDTLSDWVEDKFGNKYRLVSSSSGKLSLAIK